MLINKSYQTSHILQENITPAALSALSMGPLQLLMLINRDCRRLGASFRSEETLASILGCDPRTIRRYKAQLKELGLLSYARRDGFLFETCTYRITNRAKRNMKRVYNLYRTFKSMFFSIALLVTPNPVSEPGVLQYKLKGEETRDCYFPNQYLSINPSPSLIQVIQTPTVRESYKQQPQKRGSSMTDRQSINDVRSLKLTQWGKIRLQAFSDRVIRYADNLMKSTDVKKLKDPFSFFVSTCLKESARLGETPNQTLVQELYKTHNAPVDKEYIERRQDVDSSSATGFGLDSQNAGALASAGLASMAAKVTHFSKEKFTKQELTDIDKAYCVLKGEAHKFWLKLGKPDHCGWNRFIPYCEYFKRNARNAQQAIDAIQNFDIAANVVVEQQGSITEKEKETLDRNFDTLQNLRLKPNLSEFEALAVVTLENTIEEAKRKWGLSDEWKKEEWQDRDKEIIAWSLSFLETMQNHWNSWYKDLKREIELGPTSPRALTRELQEGLHLMRELLEEGKSNDAQGASPNQDLPTTVGANPVEEVRSEF